MKIKSTTLKSANAIFKNAPKNNAYLINENSSTLQPYTNQITQSDVTTTLKEYQPYNTDTLSNGLNFTTPAPINDQKLSSIAINSQNCETSL